ncbi:MAG: mannitol operon transcriptional activator, partial [Thermosediminibacterales bacterium]|nr:mannitol operon transcriptional activator [Thermosediminibacterales bacterium]
MLFYKKRNNKKTYYRTACHNKYRKGGSNINLTLRQRNLLKKLFEIENTTTIKQLSNQFGVSQRTIRYDLEKVEDYLKQFKGIALVKKPQKGIWLNYKNADIKHVILNKLNQFDGNVCVLSSTERQQLIITELLQKDEPITVKELGKLTGVSETTILKDLDAVEEWLNKRNLNLVRKRNYGIKVYGDETDFRLGICDILKEFADLNQLFGFLEQAKDFKILTNQNKYL